MFVEQLSVGTTQPQMQETRTIRIDRPPSTSTKLKRRAARSGNAAFAIASSTTDCAAVPKHLIPRSAGFAAMAATWPWPIQRST